MFKYPRTQHIRGSRFQHGDHDLEAVPFEDLVGKHLVIEEKCDGANCGVSFSQSGVLQLQSRGHYLRGGPREKQFNLLKQWTACHEEELFCAIGSRYVIYAEWLYAKHTIYYDALPHYFMEFDIFDSENNVFLSTPARRELLRDTSIVPVLVLAEGKFNKLFELEALVTKSNFISDDPRDREHYFLEAARDVRMLRSDSITLIEDEYDALRTCDWHPEMEGLYIKWEEDGIVKGRYKFVRESFTSSILSQEQHWHDRPIVPNKLLPGAFEKMFEQKE